MQATLNSLGQGFFRAQGKIGSGFLEIILKVLSIIIRNDSSVQLIICSKRRKMSIVDNWQPCIFPESPATVGV